MSQAATAPTPHGSSTGATPAALEQMTGVFSLSTTAQPKQRVRRKMTEDEKAEYRARRIVKACDKCARRKRKVSPASVPTKTRAPPLCLDDADDCSRVPSRNPDIRRAPSVHPQQPLDFDFDMFCVDESLTLDDAMFDDLCDLSPDMVPDPRLDPKKPLDLTFGMTPDVQGLDSMQEWQWFDHHDWRLGDQRDLTHDPTWPGGCETLRPNDLHIPSQTLPFAPALDAGNWSGNSGSSSPQASPLFQQMPNTDMVLNVDHDHDHRASISTPTWHTPRIGSDGTTAEAGGQQPQIELPQPTHTLHAHAMKSQRLRVDGSAEAQPLEDIRPIAPATLPQTVLRLLSTAKAVRTFGRRVDSSSIQSATVSQAMDVLRSSAPSQDLTRSQRTDAAGVCVTTDGLDPRHKTRAGALQFRTNLSVSSSREPSPLQDAGSTPPQDKPAAQRSPAESMDRVASPSTELYMLKRRAPDGPRSRLMGQRAQSHATRAVTAEGIPADGGAFVRLLTSEFDQARSSRVKHHRITTDNYTKPSAGSATSGLSGINATNAPGATSAINAINATSALANAGRASAASPTAVSNATPNAIAGTSATSTGMVSQPRPSYHMLCKDHHGRSVPYTKRLCDHWRYRDHHGRPSGAASPAQSNAALPLSYVLAAVVLAVCGSVLMGLPFLALLVLVQCTTKNSSWLTDLQRASSHASRALQPSRRPQPQNPLRAAVSHLRLLC
nr:hypothetical protein CFP56_20991 [Quercus suber]